MQNPTLFPSDEPFAPSLVRPEPALWIKRLLILPDPNSVVPIREVSFRRGLNIVQARQRKAGETHVVGHSVGKTLLMRLIRYTLGEHHFAVEEVRTKIANRFPTAQVVAHWSVNGVDWIVVRPLQDVRISKSFAVSADDWKIVVKDEPAHQPIADFLAAVSNAALSDLSEFSLPRARRTPKWLDVLGWLARDYECGYGAPNEWRHESADSGVVLHRDDNGQILQWMGGLMGSEEIILKNQHQLLRDELQNTKTIFDGAQKTIDVTGPTLIAKLEMIKVEGDAADREGLFAAQVIKKADEKIDSLNGLLNEQRLKSSLEKLEADEKAAQKELTLAESNLQTVTKQIELLEALLVQKQPSDSPDSYRKRSPYEDCQSPGCPMKLGNRPVPDRDPATDDHLADIREKLIEYRQLLPEKTVFRDRQLEVHANAAQAVKIERDRISTEKSGFDQAIGRWQSYKDEATSYSQARKTLADSSTLIGTLDHKIEESNKIQETVRRKLKDRRRLLSECYEYILKGVFGEEATGQINVDGKGLHPVPDSRLAPNGAAVAIMTTVLTYDIACLAAGISDIGHHPRFLLHDSPRAGDMEEPMFHRLFEVARDLELLSGNKEPAFQYIVTTTTAPPTDLADEQGPFVRLTLDARNPLEHLLCSCF